MTISWHDIAFQPGETLSGEIGEAWAWLIGQRKFRPFLVSKFGDVFFETDDGAVQWLGCSTGLIEHAAKSRSEFDDLCRANGENVLEWFAPGLVQQLHEAGKVASDGECYAFVVQPIFKECEYTPENLNPVPVREVLIGLADFHRQIADMPDAASVQIKIVD